LHEVTISKEDAPYTYEYADNYIIYPHYTWWEEEEIIQGGKKVDSEFVYNSGTNTQWLSVENLKQHLEYIYEEML